MDIQEVDEANDDVNEVELIEDNEPGTIYACVPEEDE